MRGLFCSTRLCVSTRECEDIAGMSDLIPWLMPWSGRALTLAVVAVGAWVIWLGLRRRRTKEPFCPRCDYNLTGLSNPACPECGFAASDVASTHLRPRRWRLTLIGLLIALSLPAFVAQRRMRMYGADYYLAFEPFYSIWPERTEEDVRFDHGIRARVMRDRRSFYARKGSPRISVAVGRREVWETKGNLCTIGTMNLGRHRLHDLEANGKPCLVVSTREGDDYEYFIIKLYVLQFDVSKTTPILDSVAAIIKASRFGMDRDDFTSSDPYFFNFKPYLYSYPFPSTYDKMPGYPSVWLRIKSGQFVFDAQRTRRILPSYSLRDESTSLDETGRSNYIDEVIRQGLDMIYAGHAREGIKHMEHAFGASKRDLERSILLSEVILHEVESAPYGREVLALSGWHMAPTTQPSARIEVPITP